MALSKETVADTNDDYYGAMAGEGLGGLTADILSTAYLSMVQPGTTAASMHAVGTWRNSATDENYGTEVEVIVAAVQPVWVERASRAPYNTVGRYAPNSIKVDIIPPPPGSKEYPTMLNPETKNKIQSLCMYALALKDDPSAGIIYFSPTAGSMRACKSWNNLIKAQRMHVKGADGKQTAVPAPCHMYSYKLQLELVANPQRPNEQIARLAKVTRSEAPLPRELHAESVRPVVQLAQGANIAMLSAPEMSGDAEE